MPTNSIRSQVPSTARIYQPCRVSQVPLPSLPIQIPNRPNSSVVRDVHLLASIREDPGVSSLTGSPPTPALDAASYRKLFQTFVEHNPEHTRVQLGNEEDSQACLDIWVKSFAAPPVNPLFNWIVQDSSLSTLEQSNRFNQQTFHMFKVVARPAFRDGLLMVIRDPSVPGGISAAAILDIAEIGSDPFSFENLWACGPSPVIANIFSWGTKPLRRLIACGDIMDAAKEELKKKEGPTWHLSILGVSPEAQQSGLGRALMEALCGFMDSIGAKCHLECETQWLESYYSGFGFETLMRKSMPSEECEGDPGLFFMVRRPSVSSQMMK